MMSRGRTVRTSQVPSFKCKLCLQSFPSVTIFKNHIQTHLNDDQCHICDTKFKNNKTLQTHILGHLNDSLTKTYPCSSKNCSKSFKTENRLAAHLQIHAIDQGLKCEICKKSYTSDSRLKKHLESHSVMKNFLCTVCAYQSSTACHLEEHMRTHTGVRPFPCDVCGKAFSQKPNLIRHKRTHTGEKPFICEMCGKAFVESSKLTKHLRVHLGHKNYQCTKCGKQFAENRNLTQHLLIHSGEKPHKCATCDRAFRYPSDLKEHQLVHTELKSFLCADCGKSFKSNRNLKKHVRIVHNTSICGVAIKSILSKSGCKTSNEDEKDTTNAEYQDRGLETVSKNQTVSSGTVLVKIIHNSITSPQESKQFIDRDECNNAANMSTSNNSGFPSSSNDHGDFQMSSSQLIDSSGNATTPFYPDQQPIYQRDILSQKLLLLDTYTEQDHSPQHSSHIAMSSPLSMCQVFSSAQPTLVHSNCGPTQGNEPSYLDISQSHSHTQSNNVLRHLQASPTFPQLNPQSFVLQSSVQNFPMDINKKAFNSEVIPSTYGDIVIKSTTTASSATDDEQLQTAAKTLLNLGEGCPIHLITLPVQLTDGQSLSSSNTTFTLNNYVTSKVSHMSSDHELFSNLNYFNRNMDSRGSKIPVSSATSIDQGSKSTFQDGKSSNIFKTSVCEDEDYLVNTRTEDKDRVGSYNDSLRIASSFAPNPQSPTIIKADIHASIKAYQVHVPSNETPSELLSESSPHSNMMDIPVDDDCDNNGLVLLYNYDQKLSKSITVCDTILPKNPSSHQLLNDSLQRYGTNDNASDVYEKFCQSDVEDVMGNRDEELTDSSTFNAGLDFRDSEESEDLKMVSSALLGKGELSNSISTKLWRSKRPSESKIPRKHNGGQNTVKMKKSKLDDVQKDMFDMFLDTEGETLESNDLSEQSDSNDNNYKCPVCFRMFRHKGSLGQHQLVHSSEHMQAKGSTQCQKCFKVFSKRSNLNQHMKIHQGIKIFRCEVCGKTFLLRHSLLSHQKIHSDEKPYSCDSCPRRFKLKQDLVNHTRIHTGAKPYQCAECGKTFSLNSSLNRHLRTHNGLMPYTCLICERSFSQNGNMHQHMRTHQTATPGKLSDD